MATAIETALRFVACINAHDAEAIAALLAPEHHFIDSLGGSAHGREALRNGWRQYLQMIPDYRIEVEHTFAQGEQVVMLGRALGTYTHDGTLRSENAFGIAAALRARVRDGLIAEWQVFADNEPIRRIMAAAAPAKR